MHTHEHHKFNSHIYNLKITSTEKVKLRKIIYITAIAIFFLAANSCKKQFNKPSWDTDVLIPILKTTLKIDNLINDSLLQKKPDSSLMIVYKNDFSNISLSNSTSIPDTTIDSLFITPFPLTVAPAAIMSDVIEEQIFNIPNGVQLTKVILKSGKLIFFTRNRVDETVRVRYKIPSATLWGVPFDKTFDVPPPSGNACGDPPYVFSATFDLSGYVLDMTGLSGTGFNAIITNVIIQINPQAAANVTILPCDSVYISNTFTGLIPDYAKGYFGQTTINVTGITDFSLFNHVIGGTVGLEDVNINLTLENGIGVDAKAIIGNLTATNTRTAASIALSHPAIGSPLNINRAVDNSGTVAPSYYTVALNPGNSNIKNLIENLPDKIGYSVNLDINPLGNVSGGNDFVYYTPGFKASLDMMLPLSLVANDLTLADTIDISIPRGNLQNGVNYATLTLYADNGFPFDASIQIFMMDNSANVIDELTGAVNTIDAAPIDASLKVISKRMTKIIIPLSEEKINKLIDSTKKLKITAKFNTSAKPAYMKIYSNYSLDFQLVGDFNYTVDLHK